MRRTVQLIAEAFLPCIPVGAALIVLNLIGTPVVVHLAIAILAVLVYYVYLVRSDSKFGEVFGRLGVPGLRR